MMGMRFTKMQGSGNDYVYVDGFREEVRDPRGLAPKISDRHFGVGSDGLIIIRPPESSGAHCRMEMYNADGSRAEMCGNGIRCVAKYARDHGIAASDEIRIETDAGTKTLRTHRGPDGRVREVDVDMGPPILARRRVPFLGEGNPEAPAIRFPLAVRGSIFPVTTVSMGNPHAVVRLGPFPSGVEPLGEPLTSWTLATLPIEEWGPHFERHPLFPERVNTEFISVRSPTEVDFRVWERGSGETLACGTGACAAVVAGVLEGTLSPAVLVHLRGGDLSIRWEGISIAPESRHPEGGTVILRGPAEEVFSGEWP
jgi:diaminopimelate epimerase